MEPVQNNLLGVAHAPCSRIFLCNFLNPYEISTGAQLTGQRNLDEYVIYILNGKVLAQMAQWRRMVFFTGLPASGKLFLLRRQIIAAVRAGRQVHSLRRDTALAAFKTELILASCEGRCKSPKREVLI